MLLSVSQFKGNGKVIAPPSKSFAHRSIILSCLYGENCEIENVGKSDDVFATTKCMSKIGADVFFEGENLKIGGIDRDKRSDGEISLDFKESGSTFRFMLPILGALGIKASFSGKGRLFNRPISPLMKVLSEHGCSFNGNKIEGKLSSGVYEIDGSESSQFISGLLMALPFLKGESEIIVKGSKVSSGYIDLTVSMLRDIGISVERQGQKIFVENNGKVKIPDKIICEGDWSGAAVFLGFGATGGKVIIGGLNYNSLQPDKKLLEILAESGVFAREKDGEIEVKGGDFSPFDLSVEQFPDLAPVICVLATKAKGQSVISGIKRLKDKESDRLRGICETLEKARAAYTCDGERFVIDGGKTSAFSCSGFNDHRIVMAQTLLASFCDGESFIDGAECVNKSYVGFFDDVKKIGGKTDVRF